MTDEGTYPAAFLVIVMVFVGGFWVGKITARGAVVKTVEGSAKAAPALRCTNGANVKPWTQAEAESRYHAASMYLRSAEGDGLWNDRGKRAVKLATAMLLEVLICTDGIRGAP